MKIICVMVSSLNGFTTYGNDPNIYTWTSQEDKDHFFSLIEQATCIIMGKKTYERAKGMMKHKEGRLRVVLTSSPEQYYQETIPGQLEFTRDAPSQLVKKIEERGFTEALLVGGSTTNAAFLKENLIDQLVFTIEPVIFGTGNPLFAKSSVKKNLTFLSSEKLNNRGTLLVTYSLS